MAQPAVQLNSIHLKPITLTILPQALVQSSIMNSSVTVVKTAPTMQIPNFNHVPITPTITHNNLIKTPNGMTLEEKERRRLERDRERCARYRQKVSDYKRLGTLKTEKEKITSLVILCYPELKNMSPSELDQKVSQFISSLNNHV